MTSQCIDRADITIATQTVLLKASCSTHFKVGKDVACQTDITRISSEDSLEELLNILDLSDTFLDNCLMEVIEDFNN